MSGLKGRSLTIGLGYMLMGTEEYKPKSSSTAHLSDLLVYHSLFLLVLSLLNQSISYVIQ
jgi:hypothetical protein